MSGDYTHQVFNNICGVHFFIDLTCLTSFQNKKNCIRPLEPTTTDPNKREKRMNLTKLFSTNWSWTCQHKHVSVVKKNTKHNRLQKNTQTEHTDTVEEKKRKVKMKKEMGFLSGVQKSLKRILSNFPTNQVSLSMIS